MYMQDVWWIASGVLPVQAKANGVLELVKFGRTPEKIDIIASDLYETGDSTRWRWIHGPAVNVPSKVDRVLYNAPPSVN